MPITAPLKADKFLYPLGSEPLTEALDTDDVPDDGYYNASNFNEPVDLGNRTTYHLGEDWNGEGGGDTDLGDPVSTIANGIVVEVVDDQTSATSGFGNYVVVQHELAAPIIIDGQTVTHVHSLYAHLQSAAYGAGQTTPISVGDAVGIGEQIGAVGKSGFANLAHLHFEITLNDTLPTSDDGYNPAGAPAGWTDPSDFITEANAQLASAPLNTVEAIDRDLWEIMADFSQAAYPDNESARTDLLSSGGWEVIPLPSLDPNNYEETQGLFEDGYLAGDYASSFIARGDDAAVISFGGTDQLIDGVLDILTMTPFTLALQPLVQAFNNFVSDPDSGIGKVYVTGHSLGGALAAWYMLSEQANESGPIDYEAVTFAAPGFNEALLSSLITTGIEAAAFHDQRVNHFEIVGDLVPDLLFKIGDTININPNGYLSGILDLHRMSLYETTSTKLEEYIGNDTIELKFHRS